MRTPISVAQRIAIYSAVQNAMGSVPICLVACAMILAQSGAAEERSYDPKDVSAGAQMFRSHCARCHGVKGEGGIGPSLAAGIFNHGNSDRDLVQNISNGIPYVCRTLGTLRQN